MPTNQTTGLFIQTNPIIDSGYLNSIEQFDPDLLKQLFLAITKAIADSNDILNQKDSGLYVLQEFLTGQQFFPNPALSSLTAQTPVLRQPFRKAIK